MPPAIRRVVTSGLRTDELVALRAMLEDAFGDDPEDALRDEDWEHTLGGVHVLLEEGGSILSHAAVVGRTIAIDGRPLRTGYVEGVATRPGHQGQGLASAVMAEVAAIIRDGFELGMLGTGVQGFYERLGWRIWRGPSGVRHPDGSIRMTPDEDGYLMILLTPATPDLDPTAPIVCEWRPGDSW